MLAALAVAVTLAGIPAPSVTVVGDPCPAATATGICTIESTIYAPANASRFAVQHEIGHAFDEQFLDDGERNALKRAMGMPISRPWQLGTGLTHEGLNSPSERFADLYAACRLKMDPEGLWESAYDYQPTRRSLRRACGVVRRASSDYSPGTTR